MGVGLATFDHPGPVPRVQLARAGLGLPRARRGPLATWEVVWREAIGLGMSVGGVASEFQLSREISQPFRVEAFTLATQSTVDDVCSAHVGFTQDVLPLSGTGLPSHRELFSGRTDIAEEPTLLVGNVRGSIYPGLVVREVPGRFMLRVTNLSAGTKTYQVVISVAYLQRVDC